MLQPKFAFNVIYIGNNKNSKKIIFWWCLNTLFNDFESMLLQKLKNLTDLIIDHIMALFNSKGCKPI